MIIYISSCSSSRPCGKVDKTNTQPHRAVIIVGEDYYVLLCCEEKVNGKWRKRAFYLEIGMGA
jgi:hypothetical protein